MSRTKAEIASWTKRFPERLLIATALYACLLCGAFLISATGTRAQTAAGQTFTPQQTKDYVAQSLMKFGSMRLGTFLYRDKIFDESDIAQWQSYLATLGTDADFVGQFLSDGSCVIILQEELVTILILADPG